MLMTKRTFSPCARVWMRSDAQMMAEKKAKKEEQKAAMIAAGKGDQVAAEEARKRAVRDAKNSRKAYNANPLAAKQMGLAPVKGKPGFNGDKTGGQGKAAMGGGAAGGKGGGDAALKELEKKLMPLVKTGDAKVDAGDFEGGLALYQEAMDGFRGAGHKVRSTLSDLPQATVLNAVCRMPRPLAGLTAAVCVDLCAAAEAKGEDGRGEGQDPGGRCCCTRACGRPVGRSRSVG